MSNLDRIQQAMRDTPRELFVPEDLRHLAELDRPLPIGYDQTISQPTTVYQMLEWPMFSLVTRY